MNGRTVFKIAAVGAGIYILCKNRFRRQKQRQAHREAQASWENEGGAPANTASSRR